MADYQLTDTPDVIRTSDGARIPNDPANRDRVIYNEWLAAGGVPDPYVPPPAPEPVIDANARLDAGILAAVQTVITASQQVHAIPHNFTPANFTTLLAQMKIICDAFVAMLQAQTAQPPPP